MRQPGASDARHQLAAETAEMIFASGGKLADAQRYYTDVRQRVLCLRKYYGYTATPRVEYPTRRWRPTPVDTSTARPAAAWTCRKQQY